MSFRYFGPEEAMVGVGVLIYKHSIKIDDTATCTQVGRRLQEVFGDAGVSAEEDADDGLTEWEPAPKKLKAASGSAKPRGRSPAITGNRGQSGHVKARPFAKGTIISTCARRPSA